MIPFTAIMLLAFPVGDLDSKVLAVAIAPDEKLVAASDFGGRVYVIDWETGKLKVGIHVSPDEEPDAAERLTFSPCGRYLCACAGRRLLVLDLTTSKVKFELEWEGKEDRFWHACFFPDGKSVAVRKPRDLLRVGLDGKTLAKTKAPAPKGRFQFPYIAVAGDPPLVYFWDEVSFATWDPKKNRVEAPSFRADKIIAVDPRHDRVACVEGNRLKIKPSGAGGKRTTATTALEITERTYPHGGNPSAVFSPNGNILYVAARENGDDYPSRLIVWDLAQNKAAGAIGRGHYGRNIAVSTKLLVIGTQDELDRPRIFIWDVGSLVRKREIDLSKFVE